MTTSEKSRALAEWAFFTLMFAVAGLAGYYLPILEFFVAMLLPLPAMLIVLKCDARYAILGLAVAGLLFFVFMPPAAVFILVFRYGLLGVLFGLLFKNRISSGKILSFGMIYAGLAALLYLVLSYFAGNNLFVIGEEVRSAFEQAIAAYRDAGMLNNIPAELQESFSESIISTYELLFPGQYIISAAVLAAITYFLARACLVRLNYFLAPGLAFTMISLPWYSIWGPIVGLALTLAGDNFSWLLAAKIGKNILYILFWLYIFLGLSVAAYIFRKINVAWPLKLIILIFAIAYPPFSMVVLVLLGVIDPLVNLRRLPPPA
ncbi:MAG: DUF2232 domain-containing protein [Desulfotomaculaceae bacterium]|nr:DUF2232 domain-containing protein [Desulfotomaculaceae bacterium]MDD4767576.1 DUF2232 domain-containing protein [Desulfotomaculaceae bacterium]